MKTPTVQQSETRGYFIKMGKFKELLIEREYNEMINNNNPNLREYLLTIESEFKPEAYEQDNYYLVKYCLLDLRSLEPITISERVTIKELEQKIPDQIAKIIHESNFSIDTYNKISYKALINNGWTKEQYLFSAIPLKESINSLNDILIFPSSEKAIIHYLRNISDSLNGLSSEIYEMRTETNTNLTEIDKALDLIGYVMQR